jgi:hypothetical protein
LASCASSLNFTYPPPETYRATAPAGIEGNWLVATSPSHDQMQITRIGAHTLRLTFPNAKLGEVPQDYVEVETVHFANFDWVVLDMGISKHTNPQPASVMLIQYALKDANTLCAQIPQFAPFASAIQAGKLAGTLQSSPANPNHWSIITVNATGADWVKWWTDLPDDQKLSPNSALCFQRETK